MKKNFPAIVCLLMLLAVATHAQPAYLKAYEKQWKADPHQASLEWFKQAGFGMFVHFSPASVLPGGTDEYIKTDSWFVENGVYGQMDKYGRKQHLRNKMTTVTEGAAKVIRAFCPDRFCADSLAALAVKAGMKYITFTTQHVVGKMYMFDTSLSPWNSRRLLARDFVKELSDACNRYGLGLFLYVTPPNDLIHGEVKTMLKELLTNYGPIAGIWFDGIGECYRYPNEFLDAGSLYAYVRELQPQCLVSFKTGFTGDEDFLAPEWSQVTFDEANNVCLNIHVKTEGGLPIGKDVQKRMVQRIEKGTCMRRSQCFKDVWEQELCHKPVELCTTLLKDEQWFDVRNGQHKSLDDIRSEYSYARTHKANYLLNVALRADGSIHPADQAVLGKIQEQ
ncbi:MAG: alpha-L-fucosidase [Prevotella sp.]